MKNITIERFGELNPYDLKHLENDIPTCSFNGVINFRKYKITVKEVVEPVELLTERLQKLWDENDNYHYWQPIRDEAKKLGYDLIGSPGKFKNKK